MKTVAACAYSTGASGTFGTGEQNGCALVPLLQGGSHACDAGASGTIALARTMQPRVTPTPGATMRRGLVNLRSIGTALQRCWGWPWACEELVQPTGHDPHPLDALGREIGDTSVLHESQNTPGGGS